MKMVKKIAEIISFLPIILSIIATQTLQASDLKLGTFNIRNFKIEERNNVITDPYELTKVLESTKADLLALQEIVEASEFKKYVRDEFPSHGVALSDCGGFSKQKLGFLYNKKVLKLEKFWEDGRTNFDRPCHTGLRPLSVAKFRWQAKNLSFIAIAVHLKAGSSPSNIKVRTRQHREIFEFIREIKRKYSNIPIFMMGDFNTTDYFTSNQNRERFQNFLQSIHFSNQTESLKCSAYWSGRVPKEKGGSEGNRTDYLPSLLDHITMSSLDKLNWKVVNTNKYSHCAKFDCQRESRRNLGLTYHHVSDHCPLTITLEAL